MIDNLVTAAGLACFLFGLFVFFSAVLGLFRFDYVLNRMHAAAVGDSLGIFCVLIGLIVLKPEAAYKMAGDFARYLRFTLDSVTADGGIGSFREEIRAVRAYADINQQQLGDRLHMVYEIPDVDFPIPLLTIQPIVENAILHGIKPKVGGGTVSLKLEELPDHWQVTVTDDGVGFGLEAVREKGSIGLENVRRRIARFPGSELRITSTVGMGTQAVLTYGKRGKNMENLSKST